MDTRGDFYKKARYKETKRVQLMADRKRLPIVEFNETRFQEARNRRETKKKKRKKAFHLSCQSRRFAFQERLPRSRNRRISSVAVNPENYTRERGMWSTIETRVYSSRGMRHNIYRAGNAWFQIYREMHVRTLFYVFSNP